MRPVADIPKGAGEDPPQRTDAELQFLFSLL